VTDEKLGHVNPFHGHDHSDSDSNISDFSDSSFDDYHDSVNDVSTLSIDFDNKPLPPTPHKNHPQVSLVVNIPVIVLKVQVLEGSDCVIEMN